LIEEETLNKAIAASLARLALWLIC
jgi:hypothetical protein